MRRYVPIILIVGSLGASICFSYLALSAGRLAVRELVADSAEHDFGTVKPGTLTHTFKVTNRTKREIEFLGITKSCGCTDVTLPKKTLGRNESVAVTCVVDARGRRGKFVSFFRIIYKAQQGEEQALTCVLRAKVDAVVSIEPADMEFTMGRSQTQRFRVISAEPSVKVKEIACEHRAFKVRRGEDGFTFDVAFDSSQWQDNEGSVPLHLETTWKTEKLISVPVYVLRKREKR
ncbi:MAG: DUF1573 domain-containing protein [Planctomycetota bacterium]|nr:DUF1573 domain-containing protein [Planctomycetota bacterium]